MKYDYNEICKVYDDVREADFEAVKFLVNKGKLDEESKVLEIGCGTGNYLKLIHGLTNAEVWGVDQSAGMLDKAREKCKAALLVETDAVDLEGIPHNEFDLVYMVDVIHHIVDIDGMFKSIYKVLKNKACLIIFSDNHEHIKNRLTTKYFPETLEPELKRYQDTDELIESLERNGFNKIQSGTIEIGTTNNYGEKLIEIASKRGYSMFGLISEEAIKAGIERIKKDMVKEPIIYNQKAPFVIAFK